MISIKLHFPIITAANQEHVSRRRWLIKFFILSAFDTVQILLVVPIFKSNSFIYGYL